MTAYKKCLIKGIAKHCRTDSEKPRRIGDRGIDPFHTAIQNRTSWKPAAAASTKPTKSYSDELPFVQNGESNSWLAVKWLDAETSCHFKFRNYLLAKPFDDYLHKGFVWKHCKTLPHRRREPRGIGDRRIHPSPAAIQSRTSWKPAAAASTKPTKSYSDEFPLEQKGVKSMVCSEMIRYRNTMQF